MQGAGKLTGAFLDRVETQERFLSAGILKNEPSLCAVPSVVINGFADGVRNRQAIRVRQAMH